MSLAATTSNNKMVGPELSPSSQDSSEASREANDAALLAIGTWSQEISVSAASGCATAKLVGCATAKLVASSPTLLPVACDAMEHSDPANDRTLPVSLPGILSLSNQM